MADSRPKLTGVELLNKESSVVGTYPTLKLSSKGADSVQYSVYMYSKSKKTWENVSNGYTTALSSNKPYTMKLKKPLEEGDNSFSVWVKKSYASAINKGGYDDFQSFKITTTDKGSTTSGSTPPSTSEPDSQKIPSLISASIDSSEQKVGEHANLKVVSDGEGKVQYKVYLYSPTTKTWDDVTGGYTAPVDATSKTSLRLNKALHKGENSFSVWVKRNGKTPANKAGYDDFLSYKINVNPSGELEGDNQVPSIKSALIDLSEQKVGVKPTMKITSTGSEQVEYKVMLYSSITQKWEDVSNGFSLPQNPSSTYSVQLTTPLGEGENNFNILVKRYGKDPSNNEGYDNFLNYKVNVGKESSIIPKITDVTIDNSEVKLGSSPTLKIKSNADVNVQYKVYLYSQSKEVWEDVSNGYTSSVSPDKEASIKINAPLQSGRNNFSIWVKRTDYPANDPGGYDSFVNEAVNVYNTYESSKISNVTVNSSKTNLGTKPEITVSGLSGDGKDISYKAFLYSNSQRKWLDACSYSCQAKNGQATTIALSTPLEAGTNKILVWSKRTSLSGEIYEDYKIVTVDAIKPAPFKKTIVVDPGHGGKDSGAVSDIDGTLEKDIALIVGSKLGNLLSNSGYNVLYTRTTDSTAWDSSNKNASLKYRYTFANDNSADLFVSVHCNSGGGTGTEVLYSKQNPKKDEALAKSILSEVVKTANMKNRGIKNYSNWQVVTYTKMPASLVELGFIDHKDDLAKLKSSSYQDKFAQAIYSGITNYLGN